MNEFAKIKEQIAVTIQSNPTTNQLFNTRIEDYFFTKALIAYNVLASTAFLHSYFTTLFGG